MASKHRPYSFPVSFKMLTISVWIGLALVTLSTIFWGRCGSLWTTLLQRLFVRLVPSPENRYSPAARTFDAAEMNRSKTPAANIQGLNLYKELYFKLQNLEEHPYILHQARDVLISLFAEKLSEASESCNGILSLETFNAVGLAEFLKAQDEEVTFRWETYLERRNSGGPREMFKDLDHAKWWLKQVAPVKLVDGAWLGHIHKITTPFDLRSITKRVWQVMSE